MKKTYFETYWDKHGLKTNPAVLELAFREVAQKAWNEAVRLSADSIMPGGDRESILTLVDENVKSTF